MASNFRTGFVAFVGKPNAGKSTLLNTILQEKIAIVTNKPQTTRDEIHGIYTDDNMQIIFLDTPGIHKYHNQLGKIMNKKATSAAKGTDIICLLVPTDEKFTENEEHILQMLKEKTVPIFLLLTKTDLVTKEELFMKINEWKEKLPFKEIIPISSFTELNLNVLMKKIYENLPEGEKFFQDDQKTNLTSQQVIKEIVREKIILLTHQEIPHSVAVVIESIEEVKRKEPLLKIEVMIVVERSSQKSIILGKRGGMIKNIGIQSRKELEVIFKQQVMLKIFVKVIDEWRNNPKNLKEFGYL